MNKRLVSFSLKFFFSALIIILLLVYKISLREVLITLKSVDLFWLILSFSLHSLGLLISAVRWQILIRAQGDTVPLSLLTQSYLVGTFFNNFLPTRFGGDVVRIWDGSRYSRSLMKSTAIILVERMTGIIVLLAFALAASLLRLDMASNLPVIWAALGISVTGLGLISLFFFPVFQKVIGFIPEKGVFVRIKIKILEFRQVVLFYKEKKKELGLAFLWAFLLQVNVVLHYYFIGLALSLEIKLIDYFIFVPIVLLILTIPITINGLGLREGSYIGIFRYYGILPEVAFTFSLIDVAFGIILGIIGGIIYAIRK
ncbi:MAG: lysylphosphatidylglycerol synthase transmembrane domain-containing protein [Acidobacteriota bacterium]